MVRFFNAVGAPLLSFCQYLGELILLAGDAFRSIFTHKLRWKLFLNQIVEIGVLSQVLVIITGGFTGAVFTAQAFFQFNKLGMGSAVGAVVSVSLCRELAPVLTALMVAGRVGAAMSAEIGTMKVTEQIDAMEASAVDPLHYLAATRVLACILMLPLLTVASNFSGILMGWIATTLAEPISLRLFLLNGFKGALFSDFVPPILKTAVFGLIIGTLACFQGMRTKGGTEGVGRSATSSVVLASLFVILADVILVRLILTIWG